MVRSAILGRFRATWLSGALPMVVEHRSDTVETLCASPSLWMGGRALLEDFEELGLGPGRAVRFDLPLGIRFVQGLVACLRSGAAIDLRAAQASRAHASLDLERLEARSGGETLPEEIAWIGADGGAIPRDELDALAERATSVLSLSEGLRVRIDLAGIGAKPGAEALLGALWAGCELQALMDPGADRTPLYLDSPPERVFDASA